MKTIHLLYDGEIFYGINKRNYKDYWWYLNIEMNGHRTYWE